MAYTEVIDVSVHNGTIDWEKVKEAGYHAIIRCGYGDDIASQDDRQWERNIAEVERLGIPHGVYIYSYAKDDSQARSEAAHVLRLVKGRKLQYPIYYDVEEASLASVSKRNAEVFGQIIEGAGYWAGVYSSESWWSTHLKGLERFTKWVAKWSSKQPSMGCDLWQYTSKGSVPGINGNVDVSRAFVYFPAITQGSDPADASINVEAGRYLCLVNKLRVRTGPGLSHPQARWQDGDLVYYNSGSLITHMEGWSHVSDGYVWGRYVGAQSGQYRYIAVRSTDGREEFLKRV